MLSLPVRGPPTALPPLTQHRQVGTTDDGRDAAAAKHGLTLVVAGVAARGVGNGEPAVEVTDATCQQYPILLPNDVKLDQGPEGGEGAGAQSQGLPEAQEAGQGW